MLAEVNAHLTECGLLMRQGTVVDATIIAAPSSTKNGHRFRPLCQQVSDHDAEMPLCAPDVLTAKKE